MPDTPTIELLRPDHAAAVLTFERENREFFAKTVPDRGDDYFETFAERHAGLLAEQAEGKCYFHVIVDNGRVVGRINLVDVANQGAELGFRVAEHAAGKGLATAAVRRVFELAATYGLTRLTAAATLQNAASRAVLTRTGFEATGETVLGGLPATTYIRRLDTSA